MAPLSGTHTKKCNRDKIERVQRRATRFVKSRYTRYSSVSDKLDELGWLLLSQRRQVARLFLFYKCPSKASLLKCIRALGENRKHNMKFRHIGHTTSQYGQAFFPKTISVWNGPSYAEALSLDVFKQSFL